MTKNDKQTARKPELLAPAGRIETFAAALDAGADAVYVGSHRFNARLRAPNFGLDGLSRMAEYAHDLGRRLYITVNTLIKEHELPDLVRLLDELRRIGPDALIIQDLGTYRSARALCPEIPLHSSTQMTIHNLDGALQAKHMGFERVILARELTLEEIRIIRASCDIELETFIHGALCYSISGQCLFSSRIHGKSANRGRCLQPCRRQFEQDGDEPSALYSMRDLSTAPILERLMAAGIRSFKIEGRLKPAETIAQTVRAYRLLIDSWPRITGEIIEESRDLLDTAVGRESTTGYYTSPKPERIVGGQEAQSGRPIGTVESAGKDWFTITPLATLKVGDRIRIQTETGKPPRAFVVREIRKDGRSIKRSGPGKTVEVPVPFAVPRNAVVVKAADSDAIRKGDTKRVEKALASMTQPSRAVFSARIKEAGGGITVEVRVGTENVRANHPYTRRDKVLPEQAAEILSEPTQDASVRLLVDKGSIPAFPLAITSTELAVFRDAILKRVERALDAQREKLIEQCQKPATVSKDDSDIFLRRWIITASAKQAKELADLFPSDGNRKNVWLAPLCDVDSPDFFDLTRQKTVGVVLPTLTFTSEERKNCLRQLKKAQELGVRVVAVSNPGHFQLLRSVGLRKVTVLSLPGIGCLNSACHAQLIELGVNVGTASLECDSETWGLLKQHSTPAKLASVVYGQIPLFQSRVSGPNVPSGEMILAEPRRTLRVISKNGITTTLEHAPFVASPQITDDLADTDWIYDFTWSTEAPDYLAKTVAAIENGELSEPSGVFTMHPMTRRPE